MIDMCVFFIKIIKTNNITVIIILSNWILTIENLTDFCIQQYVIVSQEPGDL